MDNFAVDVAELRTQKRMTELMSAVLRTLKLRELRIPHEMLTTPDGYRIVSTTDPEDRAMIFRRVPHPVPCSTCDGGGYVMLPDLGEEGGWRCSAPKA